MQILTPVFGVRSDFDNPKVDESGWFGIVTDQISARFSGRHALSAHFHLITMLYSIATVGCDSIVVWLIKNISNFGRSYPYCDLICVCIYIYTYMYIYILCVCIIYIYICVAYTDLNFDQ